MIGGVPRAYDSTWRQMRLLILQRDRGVCQIGLPGCTLVAGHVDHIVPLSEGGARLDPSNLRASCERCNLRRNALRRPGLEDALGEALSGQAQASPSRVW